MIADVARSRPDGFTDVELRAWRGLLVFHATLTRELSEALEAGHQLSIAEYEVLLKLSTSPGGALPLAELGARAYLTQSGLSRLVDRLSRRGLLERAAAESDRRGVTVAVTAEGRALWRRASKAHTERVRTCFLNRIDDAELQHLGDLWERLGPDA